MARKLSSVAAFGAGFVGALAISLYTAGCNSGNTSGGDEDFSGSEFVAGEDTAGRISVEINEERLPVAETTGFHAYVRNQDDQPVANVRVTCATEIGLALVEPTTSVEITDGAGQISGRIGCAAPGSFRLGCRLPGGANFREFKTIVCTGEAPAGFDGFAGAPQGGLGSGGVADPDDGDVRITSAVLVDGPSEGSSVDVIGISDCDGDVDTDDPEPFYDTSIKILVKNTTDRAVTLTSLTYRVPNASGSGTAAYVSSPLAFLGNREVPAEGEATVTTLFANASGGEKFFTGRSTAIPSSLGFRSITITVRGVDGNGREFEVDGSTVGSFGNFNRCGG
ncbi:MAG: hypothetical protein QY326_04495 [Bdellovibrionota bacterium]|nr:MAG: hypothetical protein QY326_04495 [Bdellovibrionota bacterium]